MRNVNTKFFLQMQHCFLFLSFILTTNCLQISCACRKGQILKNLNPFKNKLINPKVLSMSDNSLYDNAPKSEQTTQLLPITINDNTVMSRSNNITTNAPSLGGKKDLTPGRCNLQNWLGHTFRVVITDGRVLVGFFNCTDKDANVVLSMCAEYLEEGKDARILGNVMIPGKHIVSIAVDMPKKAAISDKLNAPLASEML